MLFMIGCIGWGLRRSVLVEKNGWGEGGLNLTGKILLFVLNVMFEMAFGLCYMDFV